MLKVELDNISNNPNVLVCAVMDRNEITNKLNQLNGFSFNYILGLENEIVYIGYSSRICMRLYQHKYDKDFDKVILIELTDKKSARLMEKNLIKQYKPKLNYQYLH
jgi:predicted GIY-YIG superfamily endonuclease